jgi:hypothetical protein
MKQQIIKKERKLSLPGKVAPILVGSALAGKMLEGGIHGSLSSDRAASLRALLKFKADPGAYAGKVKAIRPFLRAKMLRAVSKLNKILSPTAYVSLLATTPGLGAKISSIITLSALGGVARALGGITGYAGTSAYRGLSNKARYYSVPLINKIKDFMSKFARKKYNLVKIH